MARQHDRPSFFHDGQEVTAGGVLLVCRSSDDELRLLLSRANGEFEDCGGRTDVGDRDVCDTIAREMHEETNGMIARETVLKQLQPQSRVQRIYIPASKYVLAVVPATEHQCALRASDFGDAEVSQHPGDNWTRARTIRWVRASELRGSRLHVRLWHATLDVILKAAEAVCPAAPLADVGALATEVACAAPVHAIAGVALPCPVQEAVAADAAAGAVPARGTYVPPHKRRPAAAAASSSKKTAVEA